MQLSRTRIMLWCNYIHLTRLYTWYVWCFTSFDVILHLLISKSLRKHDAAKRKHIWWLIQSVIIRFMILTYPRYVNRTRSCDTSEQVDLTSSSRTDFILAMLQKISKDNMGILPMLAKQSRLPTLRVVRSLSSWGLRNRTNSRTVSLHKTTLIWQKTFTVKRF